MKRIKVHFSIKRKIGDDKEVKGKIVSIGLHIVDQADIHKGLIRLTSIDKDKFSRLKNNQLVITPDGLGTIKDFTVKKDETGLITLPGGVNVRFRNQKAGSRDKIYYSLNHIYVVDLIDNKTGKKYPAVEIDYPMLLIDDAPAEFIINKNGRANLSISSRLKYSGLKIFAKKQNGVKILTELIDKKIWNPAKGK